MAVGFTDVNLFQHVELVTQYIAETRPATEEYWVRLLDSINFDQTLNKITSAANTIVQQSQTVR